jgi:Spy/CpxP family protein refolding chaperone
MILRLGLAIAGVFMAGAAAGAQAPGGGPGMGMGPGMGSHRPPFEQAFGGRGDQGRWWNDAKIVEKLKLTDAQRKSMDDILLEHQEKLIDLRASLEKAELSLEPLVNADTPNEAQILAGIDRVASARAELEKANARYLLGLRGKLTAEQWKMVQDFREHRGEQGRGMGRGDWGPGGPGPGQGGPGMQYRHRLPPPPPGAPPAPSAAPVAPGPQTMDNGAGADATSAPPVGAEQ